MVKFLKSLGAAMLGGAIMAAADAVTADKGEINSKHLKNSALVGALITVSAYLKKPPSKTKKKISTEEQ